MKIQLVRYSGLNYRARPLNRLGMERNHVVSYASTE